MEQGPQFPKKENNSEIKEKEAVLNLLNTLVYEKPFSGNIKDKESLFKHVQEEWLLTLEEHDMQLKKEPNEEVVTYLERICKTLSRTKSGFADTPKLMEMLSDSQNGTSCLANSFITGALLEKENIPYKFLQPYGHIVVQVEHQNKLYYVDPANNHVLPMDQLIDRVEDYKEQDIIYFKDSVKGKFYSYAFRPKNNADSLKALFGNLFVMDNLNKGQNNGASTRLDDHQDASTSLNPYLKNIDMKLVENFIDNQYPQSDEYLDKLRLDEKKRLIKNGFTYPDHN